MVRKKKVSESIVQGLKEAIAYEKGDKSIKARVKTVTITPVPHYKGKQVREIRNKLNLTQRSFALLMGVSIKTIEAWESGRNEPNGTAQRMLSLLEKDQTLPEKYDILQLGHVS